MGHPHTIYEGRPERRKRESLGTRYHNSHILRENKDIHAGIYHWKSQSRLTHHTPSMIFTQPTTPTAKPGKEVGPTAPPELAQKGYPPLDKDHPIGHKIVFQINNVVFITPTVTLYSYACKYGIVEYNNKGMAWSWRTPPYVAWSPVVEPYGIISLRNINIHEHPTDRTRISYPGLCR